MSEILIAIVLGIVQGLTEFLPVSSSGHLELAKFILQDESVGEESMLMTVVLHFATALATIVVFRKDILTILTDLFKGTWNESTQFTVKIVLSMIPAAMVGLFFEEALETLFNKRIALVGGFLLLTSILLLLADRAKNTGKAVGMSDAVIIGIAQAIAILPGISRSGATISTSVILGVDREKSARFSFLMVVPLIFGKIAKDLLSGEFGGDIALVPLSVGFVVAFFTGILACTWMIQIVKKAKLSWFAYYCAVVGVIAILVGWQII